METLTKYWLLEDFDLFEKLSPAEIRKLSDLLTLQTINKNVRIDFKNENKNHVFFLKKGTVKIVNEVDNTIKHVIRKGNIFGELALFNQELENIEVAYTLEDCVICSIDSEQIKNLTNKYKALNNSILKTYGLRITKLERRLHDLIHKDSFTRIHDFLLDYLNEFGQQDDEGKLSVKNLLTHKEIADLTNTSRQTVSNTMSLMRKKKIISYNSKFIVLLKQKT